MSPTKETALPTIRTAAAVLLLVTGAAACGDDGPSVERQAADQAQYCAAALAFGEAAAEAGVVVPPPDGAEVAPAGVQGLLDAMGARADQMVGWAPDDVRDDVDEVVSGLKGARGATAARLGAAPFRQAWERFAAHRGRVCATGGSTQGEG